METCTQPQFRVQSMSSRSCGEFTVVFFPPQFENNTGYYDFTCRGIFYQLLIQTRVYLFFRQGFFSMQTGLYLLFKLGFIYYSDRVLFIFRQLYYLDRASFIFQTGLFIRFYLFIYVFNRALLLFQTANCNYQNFMHSVSKGSLTEIIKSLDCQ